MLITCRGCPRRHRLDSMAEDELLNDPRRVARLTVIDEALVLKAIRREARLAEEDPAKAKRRAQEITDVSAATELVLSFQSSFCGAHYSACKGEGGPLTAAPTA